MHRVTNSPGVFSTGMAWLGDTPVKPKARLAGGQVEPISLHSHPSGSPEISETIRQDKAPVALESFRQLASDTNSTGSPNAKPPDTAGAAAAGDAMGAGARAGLAPGAAAGAAKGKSVEDEKAALEASGKYYKEGEGPPLEELESAWVSWFLHVESEEGNEVKMAMIGRDGYFETARIAVETAMVLRFDRSKLAFKGGVVNTTVACGTFLAERLIAGGIKFKMGDWFDVSEMGPPAWTGGMGPDEPPQQAN